MHSEKRPLSNNVAFQTLFKWHRYCGILKIHIVRKINTGIRYEPVYRPALGWWWILRLWGSRRKPNWTWHLGFYGRFHQTSGLYSFKGYWRWAQVVVLWDVSHTFSEFFSHCRRALVHSSFWTPLRSLTGLRLRDCTWLYLLIHNNKRN